MPRPSVIHTDPEDAERSARIARMLNLAEYVGPHPRDLAVVRNRLVANEREREGMAQSSRRDELDRLIVADIETLCRAIKQMTQMVDRMPKA